MAKNQAPDPSPHSNPAAPEGMNVANNAIDRMMGSIAKPPAGWADTVAKTEWVEPEDKFGAHPYTVGNSMPNAMINPDAKAAIVAKVEASSDDPIVPKEGTEDDEVTPPVEVIKDEEIAEGDSTEEKIEVVAEVVRPVEPVKQTRRAVLDGLRLQQETLRLKEQLASEQAERANAVAAAEARFAKLTTGTLEERLRAIGITDKAMLLEAGLTGEVEFKEPPKPEKNPEVEAIKTELERLKTELQGEKAQAGLNWARNVILSDKGIDAPITLARRGGIEAVFKTAEQLYIADGKPAGKEDHYIKLAAVAAEKFFDEQADNDPSVQAAVAKRVAAGGKPIVKTPATVVAKPATKVASKPPGKPSPSGNNVPAAARGGAFDDDLPDDWNGRKNAIFAERGWGE